MTTAKAKAATGPTVHKSVTAEVKEVTVESINAAADAVGAPKDATVGFGNAPYVAPVEGEDAANNYPYTLTFTWSETL